MSNLGNEWSPVAVVEPRVDAAAAAVEAELIHTRRRLHAHPEPSGAETETSLYLQSRLAELGLTAAITERGTGLFSDVTIGNPAPDAPLIAMRADIDALRMPDRKEVEYRSQRDDLCHACGHDVHSTIVLGTALAGRELADLDGESDGVRLRLIFQPAEETCEGAHWMVAAGVLEGVSAILGLHVDPERRLGEVGIRYGVLTAFCDEVSIVVEGHGGHAARPHHSRDPVAAACHLVGALYEFLPRTVDTRNANVFTVGRINGGYAPNVIPERVEINGTLRSTDPQSWTALKERILDICAGAERSTGTRIRCNFAAPLKGVDNDRRITSVLEESSRRVVGPEGVHLIEKPSLGGEDFSVYLDHVPGAMLRLGCTSPDANQVHYLHSPWFDVDERAIALGVRILLRAALVLGRKAEVDYSI